MTIGNTANTGFGGVLFPKQHPQCQYVGRDDLRCQTKAPGVLQNVCEAHKKYRKGGSAPTAVLVGLSPNRNSSDAGTGSGNSEEESTGQVVATTSIAELKRTVSASGFTELWESNAKRAKVISGTELSTAVARENSWTDEGKQMYRHVHHCFPSSGKPDSKAVAEVYDKCIKSKLTLKKSAGKPYPFGGRGVQLQLDVQSVRDVSLRGNMPVKVQHVQHWLQLVDMDEEDVKRKLELVLDRAQSQGLEVISEDESKGSVVKEVTKFVVQRMTKVMNAQSHKSIMGNPIISFGRTVQIIPFFFNLDHARLKDLVISSGMADGSRLPSYRNWFWRNQPVTGLGIGWKSSSDNS